MIEAVSKSGNPTNGERLHENADTTGFSRRYSVSTYRANQQRFLDTTDFSRVELQFLPREKTAEILGYHRL
jgi:N-acetylglutamate synthase-like GNAT family acetyltransferase